MSVTGEIKNLYSDKDKTRVLLPRTKTKAISDENGVGLDALLDEMNYNISNKAPAGYGLGEEPPIVIDANNATSPGFYCFNGNSCANIPSEWQFLYGTMIVSRGTAFIEQVLLAREINAKRTHTINEGWSEWEYVNPPMSPGVEYRTTERFNNKPVWTSLTKINGLPNTEYGSYTLASTYCDNLIRYHVTYERADGVTYIDMPEAGDIYVGSYGTPYIVFNRTTSDLSTVTAYVTLFYTKTTD